MKRIMVGLALAVVLLMVAAPVAGQSDPTPTRCAVWTVVEPFAQVFALDVMTAGRQMDYVTRRGMEWIETDGGARFAVVWYECDPQARVNGWQVMCDAVEVLHVVAPERWAHITPCD